MPYSIQTENPMPNDAKAIYERETLREAVALAKSWRAQGLIVSIRTHEGKRIPRDAEEAE